MVTTFNQSKLIHDFNSKHKHTFNPALFEKKDQDLINVMIDNILSVQRDQNFTIKVLDISVVTDYYQIQRSLKMFVVDGTFKEEMLPQYDKISLERTDYYLMIVRYYIRINDGTNRANAKFLEVPILLPKIVDKYYFRLDNQYYHPLYQITDYSLYNNQMRKKKKKKIDPNITLVTIFAPVEIISKSCKLNDIEGEPIPSTNYELRLFSKSINVMIYTMAKLGLYESLQFHGVRSVRLLNYKIDDPSSYCFIIHNKKCATGDMYLYVDKNIYDNDQVTQSDVYGIISGILDFKRPFKFSDVFSREFWLMRLSIQFSPKDPSLNKSENILKSLECSYDIRTFKRLRLPIERKRTIYHVLLWMTQEFDAIYDIDRLSIDRKRIQWAEYIASIYSTRITRSIYLQSDKGSNVTLKDIENILKIKPDMLLNKLKGKFKLTPYRDLVNDLDAFTALKYTIKDDQSIHSDMMYNKGRKPKRKAQMLAKEFSDTHVSHLGRLDLDSSTKSDPGMSGVLCPLTEVFGEFKAFSEFEEPTDWDLKYDELTKDYEDEQYNMFEVVGEEPSDHYDHRDLRDLYMDQDPNKFAVTTDLFEKIDKE